jgi:hypothetical protein
MDVVLVSRSCLVEWSIVESMRSADSKTRSFVDRRGCGACIVPSGIPVLVRGGNGGGTGDVERRGGSTGLSAGNEDPVVGEAKYPGGARCDFDAEGEGVRGKAGGVPATGESPPGVDAGERNCRCLLGFAPIARRIMLSIKDTVFALTLTA